MHPLTSLVTDHNPSWVGLVWPETPPPVDTVNSSARILNSPDLPPDDEIRDIFAHNLDVKVEQIMASSPPLSELSAEQAGLLQGTIIQASVDAARDLSPPRPRPATGKGHHFKDGYSPEFLHAYTDISRLLWRHAHRTG